MPTEQPTREQLAEIDALRAHTDLIDIRALRKNEAFNRFWLRRLDQKKKAVEEELKRGNIDKDEREIVRRLFLAYEELERIMDRDEAVIMAVSERG